MKNYLLIPGVALLLSLAAVACNPQHGQHNTVTEKTTTGSTAADRRIDQSVADPGRPAAEVARDRWRHPAQTLKFFGLRPDMHIVELWPGGGWYTRILGPIVRGEGKLTAANWVAEGKPAFYGQLLENYANLLANTENLSEVETSVLDRDRYQIAAAGSADMVLTFRNLHNWMRTENFADVVAAAHRALKPGGIFGIVEHRGDSGMSEQDMIRSGYMPEDYTISRVEAAGFKLVGRSEINANPRDDHNHPEGVWTLPPRLRLGDQDRAKYEAIGESDRFTFKFVKSAN